MNLDLLMINNTLQFNEKYSITQQLLDYAYQPNLLVEGEIPTNVDQKLKIEAIVNDTVISTKELLPGKLKWEIPLDTLKERLHGSEKYNVQFNLSDKSAEKNTTIKVDRVLISGFLTPNETMDVNKVKSSCTQQQTITLCQLNVPSGIKMLELPILYYPQLLKITLNGKKIPYRGIMRGEFLLVGITPELNKINRIEIQFVGLQWANVISIIFWLAWGVLLIMLLSKKFFKTGKSTA